MWTKIREITDNIFTLIFLYVILFVLLHFVFSADTISLISDNFNKVAIGVAALATAYFGNEYFRNERERRKKIKQYNHIYPHDQYKNTWDIIVRQDRTGEPHILDKQTSKIHHIWNMKTMYDLGWQFYDRNPVTISFWSKLKRGDFIRTRGELGE